MRGVYAEGENVRHSRQQERTRRNTKGKRRHHDNGSKPTTVRTQKGEENRNATGRLRSTEEKGVDVDEEPVSRYVQRAGMPCVWRGHRDEKKQGRANKSWLDALTAVL